MKFTKNHIVIILLINIFMLSFGAYGTLKWYGISNVKVVASLSSALIFLFFIIIVLKKNYSLFNKKH